MVYRDTNHLLAILFLAVAQCMCLVRGRRWLNEVAPKTSNRRVDFISIKRHKVTIYAILSLKHVLLALNNLTIPAAVSIISSLMFECLNFNVTHLSGTAITPIFSARHLVCHDHTKLNLTSPALVPTLYNCTSTSKCFLLIECRALN
jgi:hypothetical protein